MSLPNFMKLVELQAFLQQLREVKRAIYLPGKNERENDVDHSFTLAITAWFVSEKIKAQHDTGKLLRYALVHDMVEVYAGDTFFRASEEELNSKKQREHDALLRIEKEWGDEFPDMITAIRAYEDKSDKEARFIYALDKLMPMTIHLNDSGRTLKEKKITAKHMLQHKHDKLPTSEELEHYLPQMEELAQTYADYFYPEEEEAENLA